MKESKKNIMTISFSVQFHSDSLHKRTDIKGFFFRKKILDMY